MKQESLTQKRSAVTLTVTALADSSHPLQAERPGQKVSAPALETEQAPTPPSLCKTIQSDLLFK